MAPTRRCIRLVFLDEHRRAECGKLAECSCSYESLACGDNTVARVDVAASILAEHGPYDSIVFPEMHVNSGETAHGRSPVLVL